jgi:molybdopterin converting factor small subunit
MSSDGPSPLVLVSEHIVKSEDGLNVKLKEGVRLTIIPIVSGG